MWSRKDEARVRSPLDHECNLLTGPRGGGEMLTYHHPWRKCCTICKTMNEKNVSCNHGMVNVIQQKPDTLIQTITIKSNLMQSSTANHWIKVFNGSNLSSWFHACLICTSLETEGMSRRISNLGAIRWSRVARSRGLGPPERPDASRPTCFMPPRKQQQ